MQVQNNKAQHFWKLDISVDQKRYKKNWYVKEIITRKFKKQQQQNKQTKNQYMKTINEFKTLILKYEENNLIN